MKFLKEEETSGFKAFYKLVTNNKNNSFEVEMPLGDILIVKYDMDFIDDISSFDDNVNQDDVPSFYTISFIITKVKENVTNSYEVNNVICVNYRNMVANYKLLD